MQVAEQKTTYSLRAKFLVEGKVTGNNSGSTSAIYRESLHVSD